MTRKPSPSLKFYGVFVIFIVSVIALMSLRFVSDEDSWICSDGQWVRHGQPKSLKPSAPCGGASDPSPQPQSSPSADSNANLEIQAFLNWYNQNFKTLSLSSLLKNSQYFSPEFVKKMELLKPTTQKELNNLIVCNDTVAGAFSVSSPITLDGKTFVSYTGFYDNASAGSRINLTKSGSKWLISDIVCEQKVTDNIKNKSTTVVVYFSNSKLDPNTADCSQVFPLERSVKINSELYSNEISLQELFKGPSEREQSLGYFSFFSEDTQDALLDYSEEGGVAYINLKDVRNKLSGANSTCGYGQLMGQIISTVKHSRRVKDVVIAINSDPDLFYSWMQVDCKAVSTVCTKDQFLKAQNFQTPLDMIP